MVTEVETWERDRLMEALESYKRGLSDAPYLRKWSDKLSPSLLFPTGQGASGAACKMGDEDGGITTFVVSTDQVDRHGDVILVEGWRLEAYMRNPVFLWAHDYTQPAIGKAVDVWRGDHSLMANIEFAPTEFAREVASLYMAGFQRGVSVGFKPLEYELRRDPRTGDILGIRFTEQELLEISAAPVPANQNALRKALNGTPRMRGFYHYRGFTEEGGGLDESYRLKSGSPRMEFAYNSGGEAASDSRIPWEVAIQEILAALRSARG